MNESKSNSEGVKPPPPEEPPVTGEPVPDKVIQRTRRLSEEQAAEQRRREQFSQWLENGSDNLRDAWVSVCPVAKSSEVMSFRLTEIVDAIQRTGTIKVMRYGDLCTVDLRQEGAEIVRLYSSGAADAVNLNKLKLKCLLEDMHLNAKLDEVETVAEQPKGNTKKFIITQLKWNGQTYDCPAGYNYFKPELLGKKKADEAKKRVPAVTFAGMFKPERNSAYMVRATGLYILDFDAVENIAAALALIRKDPNVFIVFLSITASGLKVCVRGPVTRTAAEYTSAYVRIAGMKAQQWGISATLDEATKDCSRLCFMSFDPEAHVNWDAAALTWEDMPTEPTPPHVGDAPKSTTQATPESSKPNDADSNPAEEGNGPLAIDWNQAGEVPKLYWNGIPLARCLDAMRYIYPHDREPWRNVGAALKLGYGDETFPFFDLWSSFGGDSYKDPEDCRKTWDSHTRPEGDNVFTPAGILWTAKQSGWKGFETPSQWFAANFPGLEKKYGKAYQEEWQEYTYKKSEGGKKTTKRLIVVSLNEDFMAAALGKEGLPDAPAVFSSIEKTFFQYEPQSGLYVQREGRVLEAFLSGLILKCAQGCCHGAIDTKPLEFRFRQTRVLQPVVQRAQGVLAVGDDFFARDDSLVPCANGVLRLNDQKLLPFSPDFHLRGKLAVAYNPQAHCPKWESFLASALPEDDIKVFQQICGQVLTGDNLSQSVTLLFGQRGGEGKGTTIRVLLGIVGTGNVAELRTAHLEDRFEMAKLRHKFFAHGSDVPPDFLTKKTAQRIKAITGGDPTMFEYKGSNDSATDLMRINVLITSNTRLRIRLEGDNGAWQRRLIAIEFSKDRVAESCVDPHLSEKLITEEASGILNWMLAGWRKLQEAGGIIQLTERQKKARDALLMESESYVQFVQECMEKVDHSTVTVTQAYNAYVRYCAEREWTALTRYQFGHVIEDVVVREFGITTRNDAPSEGGVAQKGWYGLRLISKFDL